MADPSTWDRQRLEAEIQQAAQSQNYKRAAALQDYLEALPAETAVDSVVEHVDEHGVSAVDWEDA